MKRKWRPSVRLVVLVIALVALALPLTGLFFFRVYENQLIRQTESELIAQSAALAATYAALVRRENVPSALLRPLADDLPERDPGEPWHPVEPSLDLATATILPRREAAMPTPKLPDPVFSRIGKEIGEIAAEMQVTTLAGIRITDPDGIVIGGRNETGLSLAHVPEVARALTGQPSTVLRIRISDQPPPPVYSVSRGTRVRIFCAFPVIADGRIAGIIYTSRTPTNIVKHLYGERGKLAGVALTVLAAALVLAFVAARTISGPIRELTARTRRIVAGDRAAMAPLARHGTREVAELSENFLAMARRLRNRSDRLSSFAAHVSHELKSPLTAIQGAGELLRDSGTAMKEPNRKRFATNIVNDTQRLTLLVRRLLDLARAEDRAGEDVRTTLGEIAPQLRAQAGVKIVITGDENIAVCMAPDTLLAVLGNLVTNAAAHGAGCVTIEIASDGDEVQIAVGDDGSGISEKNRDRIFEPFFTTRREEGGTGMGLAIVRTMVEAHDGNIACVGSKSGARFEIRLPAA